MPLIKGPQRQQAGITGDLTARKISANGSQSISKKPVTMLLLNS
jgi:hypothetical protein